MYLQEMLAIRDLISPLGEDEEYEQSMSNPSGSVFNPGQIGGNGQSKQLAQPFAKVEAKVNQFNGNVSSTCEILKEEDKKKEINKEQQIWDEDEIKEVVVPKNDDRLQPEYQIKFKQTVGASDLFLGLSDMDPTSTKCQDLLMTINIPNTKFSEIQLEVTKQNVIIQTTTYFLNHTLPYEVNSKEGKAKWISDKYILELSLPIVRKDMF